MDEGRGFVKRKYDEGFFVFVFRIKERMRIS
jgi:hypothetical protein